VRRFVIAATLVVALLGVVACGDDGPNVLAGRVVGMEYDDPDTWTSSYCIQYMKVGDVSICVNEVTDTHHDDPHWKLQLECVTRDKTHRSWLEVPEHVYDETRPDTMYPPGTETCTTDEKTADMG
jgi:hypothetical protein